VGSADVKAQAKMKVGVLLDQLDAKPAKQALCHPEPWLLGASYSAVDIYTLALCSWTSNFDSKPVRDRAQLGPYLQPVRCLPAVNGCFQVEIDQALKNTSARGSTGLLPVFTNSSSACATASTSKPSVRMLAGMLLLRTTDLT